MAETPPEVQEAAELILAGRSEQALPLLDGVLARLPKLEIAFFWRAVAKLRTEQFAAAVKDFDAAIALNPDHSNSWLFRGEANKALWKLDEAWKDLSRALKLCPLHVPAYEMRANICLIRSEWNAAIDEYSKALECEPTNAHLYKERGQTWEALGDRQKGAADLEHAAVLAPNDVKIRTAVAEHYQFIEGEEERSVREWEAVVALDPGDTESRLDLADALANAGEHQKALSHLAGLSRDPSLTDSQKATLYAALGDSNLAIGQAEEAIGDFSAAIALKQRLKISSYFSLQGRSQCYEQIGDIERAIQDLTAAISNPSDIIPLDEHLFVRRGRLYLANRDLKRARADFEQAIESDTAAPNVVAEAYRARAEYHELTGNVHEASSDRTSAEEILRSEEEAESGDDE